MGSHRPLDGVRVLDIGILIPPALTTVKLSALGADVVKVEQPGGDRIRAIPPFADDGESPHFQTMGRGKRSVVLDLRVESDRDRFMQLAAAADVVVENQLSGAWARLGLDLGEIREVNPAVTICSITGFGQTGPLASLPSHGLNMDALADGLNVVWEDDQPRLGWSFTSWGNELGASAAALAITASVLESRGSGRGSWIDISCWDCLVEAHRTEIAMTRRTGVVHNNHGRAPGALYDTYLSSDGKPVLFGALEKKFFANFCRGVGRPDLLDLHGGAPLEFGRGPEAVVLRHELTEVFRTATADEWTTRFREWDCPGGEVLQISDVMQHPHFAARQLVSDGVDDEWPAVASPIRWHDADERAGSDLRRPPRLGEGADSVYEEWLAVVPPPPG